MAVSEPSKAVAPEFWSLLVPVAGEEYARGLGLRMCLCAESLALRGLSPPHLRPQPLNALGLAGRATR